VLKCASTKGMVEDPFVRSGCGLVSSEPRGSASDRYVAALDSDALCRLQGFNSSRYHVLLAVTIIIIES